MSVENQKANFVVLQTTTQPLTEAQLVEAFTALPSLTAYDAKVLAKKAKGWLVSDLTHGQAMTLMAALARQGVPVAIETEDRLPVLPDVVQAAAVHVVAEGLSITEPVGHQVLLPWEAITALACGMVRFNTLPAGRRTSSTIGDEVADSLAQANRFLDPRRRGYGESDSLSRFLLQGERRVAGTGLLNQGVSVMARGQETKPVAWFEIHNLGQTARWVVHEDTPWTVMGTPLGSGENKMLRVAPILAENAPGALINHGIQAAMDGHRKLPSYEHRGFFEREVRWLQWLSLLPS